MECCQGCRFARLATEWEGDPMLECHHSPPMPAETGAGIWPTVNVEDWCGQFETGNLIDMTAPVIGNA